MLQDGLFSCVYGICSYNVCRHVEMEDLVGIRDFE
jgi:hypothetical protein